MSVKLPKMTVEKRSSHTSHGLRSPFLPGSPEFEEQLRHVLEFVEAAKSETGFPGNLLDVHNPLEKLRNGYANSLNQFGFQSWKQATAFVKDDECNEFFVRVAKWAKREGVEMKPWAIQRGFIDGGGLGIHGHFLKLCKGILEKGFDAKWYFYSKLHTRRPLERYLERLGFVCPALFNYIHPGHPRYPAGHACKFGASVVAAMQIWSFSEEQIFHLKTAAYVLSMARSGGGVHVPEDNLAGLFLAGLPEFQFMGA